MYIDYTYYLLILFKLVKKTIFLTTISVISTWIIMYPSYLSTNDFLSELRWFYPLDYGINGLCLFWMFKWEFEYTKTWSCCMIDSDKDVQSKDNEEPLHAITPSVSMCNLDIENSPRLESSQNINLDIPSLENIMVDSRSNSHSLTPSPTSSKVCRPINKMIPVSSDSEIC